MTNANSKIITASGYNKKPCEYVDLRNIKCRYDVVERLFYRVVKCYESFVLTEKVKLTCCEYIDTHIRECFRWHELKCYLYSEADICKGKVIVIPVKIKKYE